MSERDNIRKKSVRASGQEKHVLHTKYKKLRNHVVSMMRTDSIKYNENRIEEARSPSEVWKISAEIVQPNKVAPPIILKENGSEICDSVAVANCLNRYFCEKPHILQSKIDPQSKMDPLKHIKKREKMQKPFCLKTVSESEVLKHIKSLKCKKSSGFDGLSSYLLKKGSDVLVLPLTRIVNASITEGSFPKAWKQAVITPIFKKGDTKQKENYHPVAGLPSASKVLESIVQDQLYLYAEEQRLLPKSQHGFRKNTVRLRQLHQCILNG